MDSFTWPMSRLWESHFHPISISRGRDCGTLLFHRARPYLFIGEYTRASYRITPPRHCRLLFSHDVYSRLVGMDFKRARPAFSCDLSFLLTAHCSLFTFFSCRSCRCPSSFHHVDSIKRKMDGTGRCKVYAFNGLASRTLGRHYSASTCICAWCHSKYSAPLFFVTSRTANCPHTAFRCARMGVYNEERGTFRSVPCRVMFFCVVLANVRNPAPILAIYMNKLASRFKLRASRKAEMAQVHSRLAARSSQLVAGERGFTLVELMVVTGILVVITSLILANNTRFGGAVLLENLAYDIALSMRKAQT